MENITKLISAIAEVAMATADKVATLVETEHPSYRINKIYWDAYKRESSATGYSYPDVTRLIKQQMTNGAIRSTMKMN